MKIIALASHNPVKIQATLNAFRRMFPGERFEVESLTVSSGAPAQPMSDQETLQGAIQRAKNAAAMLPEADYWVGIEGGVEDESDDMSTDISAAMAAFAWVVVRSRDRVGKARTGTFFLPAPVADLVRQGKELGDADDIVFRKSNSKQKNGAIGLLTGNVIDRTGLYEHAVVLALVPFKNVVLYSGE